MTHQYGQPFGTAPDDTDNWAGPGFTRVPAPAELEPEQAVDQAA
jgi:hypothetical protein